VNNLPKVITWLCIGSESILEPFGHQSGPLLSHYQATLKWDRLQIKFSKHPGKRSHYSIDIAQEWAEGRKENNLAGCSS